MHMPAKQFARMGLAVVLCLWLAGCAGPGGLFGSETKAPPFRDPGMSMQNAGDAIVIGQATKADVFAALGPATVIRFDSGFEVWAYGAKSSSEPAAARDEFVVLFAPSGIVKKTRLRPAYVGRAPAQPPW